MLIGVDFDNTIVCYDGLFHKVAVERDLVPANLPANKSSVRDYLRRTGRERVWIELQGHVYGVRMQDAPPFPGVLEFFTHCRQQGIRLTIISHRTRHPFQGPAWDLHQAAHEWLARHELSDTSGGALWWTGIYFELSKEEKLNRIGGVGCTHFIDDLPEFLCEPAFPSGVQRILFDPEGRQPNNGLFRRATSWDQISLMVAESLG